MDANTVTRALIAIHRELQEDAGHEPDAVNDSTCPLDDLPGFDSLLIPDAIRTLARRLGVALAPATKFPDLYRSKDGTRKLNVAEIAARFCAEYKLEKAA